MEIDLKLQISAEKDMWKYYKQLVLMYEGKEEECPSLIIVKGLGTSHMWFKNGSLLLESGQDLQVAFDCINKEDGTLSVGLPSADIYELYLATLGICKDLKIPCPQVLITDSEEATKNCRGILSDCIGGVYTTLFLRPMGFPQSIEVLSHELRHRWQHEKHEEKYFHDYMSPFDITDKESLIKYRLQAAEIDAEAFSVRYMMSIDGEKFPVNRYDSDEVNRAIEERAKKMILPSHYYLRGTDDLLSR